MEPSRLCEDVANELYPYLQPRPPRQASHVVTQLKSIFYKSGAIAKWKEYADVEHKSDVKEGLYKLTVVKFCSNRHQMIWTSGHQ